MDLREGLRTTEFWFAVVVVAAATMLLALDDISEETWKWAVTTVGGAYILGRAVVKGTSNTATAKIADFKGDLAILAASTPAESTPAVQNTTIVAGADDVEAAVKESTGRTRSKRS